MPHSGPSASPKLSKSARIRQLAAKGWSRGDIARKIGVRYQFVRNVLVQDEARRGKAAAETARGGAEPPAAKVRLGPDGRIVIPAPFREALGLKEGDALVASLEEGELRLLTMDAAVRRAQAIVRRFVPAGVSLVDELLEDRRREVEQERLGG